MAHIFFYFLSIFLLIFSHTFTHIYCHPRETVSLYHCSSVSLDTWDAPSRDGNPWNFTSSWWHNPKPSLRLNVSAGINAYVSNFVCLHFALLDTEVLNSLEELCITRVATVIFLRQSAQLSVGSVYIVIHRHCFIMCVCVCVCVWCSESWLVVWVLWHINLRKLFNAKSIFMQITILTIFSRLIDMLQH